MRLCHLADSHLGAGAASSKRGEQGLTLRQADMVKAFTEAVDRIIELKPDLCVHAGDLFDSVRPLNRIMAIAARQLHRLAAEAGIPTVVIAGNHDAPKQPQLGAALEVFEPIDNLHIAASGKLERFEFGRTTIHALPHCLTGRHLQEQLADCRPQSSSRFNVLVTHGVVAGMPEFSMADLGEQELPRQLLDMFDYVALGHYHNYKRVTDRACYSGSTERLSQAERASKKGFVEVDLAHFGIVFHEVSTRSMVDLPTIDAKGKRGDELMLMISDRMEQLDGADKIVRLKVTGVSEETLKTIPSQEVAALKEKSFDLNLRFERQTDADHAADSLSRRFTGRLDHGFLEFLETVDLTGFDRDRLKRLAIEYLRAAE
ncbi:MAG: exonuclease SbcCD subunit D [bacterium]